MLKWQPTGKKKSILPSAMIKFYCSVDPFWLLTVCNECLDCSQLHSLLYSISIWGSPRASQNSGDCRRCPSDVIFDNIKMDSLLQTPQYSRACSSLEFYIWKSQFKDTDSVLQSGVRYYIWGRKVVLNIQISKLLLAISVLISSCHCLSSTFLHGFLFLT